MNILELGFGKFELHKDIIIGIINEGIHFNMAINSILNDEIIAHYGTEQKLGYISMRENSYSIDPMVHLYNTKHQNLRSISIVESNSQIISSVDLESKFFKPGKLQSFFNKEHAINWTNYQLLN
ncbi:hypothetical protein [Nonlabens sp.]|uniref:hypothetical protein n=1 Tax=Nonlabens sp. TaxID=1888209 RepID=UPI00326510AB